MNSEKHIGLDVHPATISVAGLDSTAKLVMESILGTKAATILGTPPLCHPVPRKPKLQVVFAHVDGKCRRQRQCE